jgi:hypothetical protein
MSRLTKGMYEDGSRDGLFGLWLGQLRGDELVHNGGWYNRKGEKLGWGDLSARDLARIAMELKDGELFVILGEQDSYWNFVKKNDFVRGRTEVRPEVDAPGIGYVAEKCRYIIAPGVLYFVTDNPVTKKTTIRADCRSSS